MKDEAAAVGGAEACVKPSRAKASSYAGLQAAAAVGTVLQSSKDLKTTTCKIQISKDRH